MTEAILADEQLATEYCGGDKNWLERKDKLILLQYEILLTPVMFNTFRMKEYMSKAC